MEEQYVADRARLWKLKKENPELTQWELAERVERSLGWVKKWSGRFDRVSPDEDPTVLLSHSRARKNPPPLIGKEVVERILEIRDHPPDNLKRVPGPLTIIYYLHKDEGLKARGLRLPRSTRTVWKILDQNGRIWRPPPVEHVPVERPEPMTRWAIDFKDVSTVPPDPEGKKLHVVETLNIVDEGTSILVDAQVRDDFNAETAIIALASSFLVNGLPQSIRLDRDPRFVGSWSGADFPSPMVRFLLCLGVDVKICPPRRPDLNPFVERYHRSYDEECLRIYRPGTLEQTEEVTMDYRWHYNTERPNQAITCGNQPPYSAFPELPVLPSIPDVIDPDRWLDAVHGMSFVRKIRSHGTVSIDRQSYYVKQQLKGCYVRLNVDAHHRQFKVYQKNILLKRIPIKNLLDDPVMPFSDYLPIICQQARSWYSRQMSRRHSRRRVERATM